MLNRFNSSSRVRRRQGGASLIEVMVAVLLLSFGMLAMAGLHAVSIQNSKMSQFRTVAMQQASDMADRMRANRNAFDFDNPANPTAYNYVLPYDPNRATVPVPGCAPPPTGCTAAQRAAVDIAQFLNGVRLSLPGGSLYLQKDAAANIMNVWVLWTEPDQIDANGDSTMTSALHCPPGLGAVTPRPQCLALRVVM